MTLPNKPLILLLLLTLWAWLWQSNTRQEAQAIAAARGEATPNLQCQYGQLRLETLSEGLNHPWGMAFLPDGRILITERSGNLRVWQAGQGLSAPLTGLPAIHAQGQGGLLDVVLSPDFNSNHRIFFSYAEPHPDGTSGTAVASATLGDGALSDVQVIFRQQPSFSGNNHYGSRLAFDKKGLLWISVGERNDGKALAPDPRNTLGKVLRVQADGGIPAGNPFNNTVWTRGHRNPQGLTIDTSGHVWELEHGPKGGDELNLLQKGGDYGWPRVSFGVDYSGAPVGTGQSSQPGLLPPVYHWTPSIAPSGLAYYDHPRFPAWRGSVFVGSLKFARLHRLTLKNNQVISEEILLEGLNQRVRDVRVGPDGALYLLTDAPNGQLLRVGLLPKHL
jgi:glucose/arabinose dehydrogenase